MCNWGSKATAPNQNRIEILHLLFCLWRMQWTFNIKINSPDRVLDLSKFLISIVEIRWRDSRIYLFSDCAIYFLWSWTTLPWALWPLIWPSSHDIGPWKSNQGTLNKLYQIAITNLIWQVCLCMMNSQIYLFVFLSMVLFNINESLPWSRLEISRMSNYLLIKIQTI